MLKMLAHMSCKWLLHACTISETGLRQPTKIAIKFSDLLKRSLLVLILCTFPPDALSNQ